MSKESQLPNSATTSTDESEQRLQALYAGLPSRSSSAHQKGIIHRDIKPTNVLVALHDGTPIVKVIDFWSGQSDGAEPDRENNVHCIGPDGRNSCSYTSPEQAEAGDLDIDTRTDVYSLGVMLYESLTGVTPIDLEQLRLGWLCGNPTHHSCKKAPRQRQQSCQLTRIGTRKSLQKIARTDSKRLTQTLRGDLDVIVMKALEKDRNRRDESPSRFAADVDRFLNDEAIEARPASASYRLKKLIRRNKSAVFATTAVAIALLLGTIISVRQAVRADPCVCG